MEDTIPKGEREAGEEAQSENERIVEEFMRQNQESEEVYPSENEDIAPDKVIQWVEQAGPDPESHASEVPELIPEIESDEEFSSFLESLRAETQVGEEATLAPEIPSDQQDEYLDEYQDINETASVNDIQDNEQTDDMSAFKEIEETDASTMETPGVEDASDTENQAAEESQSNLETQLDDEPASSPDDLSAEETASTPGDELDEGPLTSDQSQGEVEIPAIPEPPMVEEPISDIDNTETEEPVFSPGTQLPEETSTLSESQDVETITSVQDIDEAEPEPPARKIALILSGGGAKGAFQVGAEKYAREVKGYHWDIIAGVSVGAMNGAMLSMHRYARLMEIWDHISDDQVYTGGFNLISLIKIALGAKSFYSNDPLQALMQREFEAGRIIDDLHVGAVSLITGEYVQFTRESLELAKAILASASIPVVWSPVDVSAQRVAMVDGGVRNISPVGDVLDLEPDEIVIINCGPEIPPVTPGADANVLSIGLRALDIMQNEIFVNDMKTFLRINALVQEAEQQGCFLHNPKNGKLLKYYPCQVIEPDKELGDTLDFSQVSVQAALRAGVRRAREVLGRP